MPGWTEEGLRQAWRALALQDAGEDWRLVRLTTIGRAFVEAGRHFPVGREALIVSFPETAAFDRTRLPEGRGFDVLPVEGSVALAGRTTVALIRRGDGSEDIFTTMAVDVLRILEASSSGSDSGMLDSFLDRVSEWQEFMAKTHRPLTPEAQVGLAGELWLLRVLLGSRLGALALDCWQGPLRAAQDFHLGAGAIEVKSTATKGAFLARINSIEQLDSPRSPLFLCALRFEEDQHGASLVDLVGELRARFAKAGRNRSFDALLMVMGYLDHHAHLYGRTLALKQARAFKAESDMPRLVRAALPAALRSASYVLDLDATQAPALELAELIETFGLHA